MRTQSLLIAGAITIAAGLLFPLSGHILDVLLIFSVSLTAAVLIITFSARRASEVSGFPLLIVLAAMLRVALSVAGSKLILSQGSAGIIIGFLGGIFVRENFVLTILAFGILTVVIFGIISRAVKSISQTTDEFVADIVPARQINIDSDLDAGLIDQNQAIELRDKIAFETGFFVSMAGAAKFILCAAVIELMVVVVDIAVSIGTAQAPAVTAQMSAGYSLYEGLQNGDLKIHATLGAGVITQISALLAAVACGCLVRKTSVQSAGDGRFVGEKAAERIKVVSSEVLYPLTAESQYGNAIVPAQTQTVAEDLEWFDESECIENERDNFSQTEVPSSEGLRRDLIKSEIKGVFELGLGLWKTAHDSDYYNSIAELIESKSDDEAKTVLMAAESIKALPVTLPVNIAMRLAQKGFRCLLIDLDLQRDAVSKVFDIDNDAPKETMKQQATAAGTPTCVSNLSVWTASRHHAVGKVDKDSDAVNMRQVIADLQSQYDRLVVYAPNIKLLGDWDSVAVWARTVMLFGKDADAKDALESSYMTDFYNLLISCGCDILQPNEVFAEMR
jgi:hypothetical protein